MWSPWAPGSAVGTLKQDLSVGGTENADILMVQVQELRVLVLRAEQALLGNRVASCGCGEGISPCLQTGVWPWV